jgi:hypothetical protein
MTTIGEIRLHFKQHHLHEIHYESEKGSYRLIVPDMSEFAAVPEYIDVKIATEEKWIVGVKIVPE